MLFRDTLQMKGTGDKHATICMPTYECLDLLAGLESQSAAVDVDNRDWKPINCSLANYEILPCKNSNVISQV